MVKIIRTVGQFSWNPTLNEIPDCVCPWAKSLCFQSTFFTQVHKRVPAI